MEKADKIKEQNKIRAKRHYDAKKAEIAQKRKEKRDEVNEIVKTFKTLKIDEEEEKELPSSSVFIPLVKPTVITTEKNVMEAMKTTPYYTVEATRKTNLQQIPLIFRATNGEPLLDWIRKPRQLIEQMKGLKQKNGKNKDASYSLTAIPRMIGAVLSIVKFMELPITPEEDKILFEGYRMAKLHYDLEQYKNKHPVLNDLTAVKNYGSILTDMKRKHGKTSLQYLVAKLYEEAPLRNDYSNIVVVEEEEDVKPSKNSIILPTSGNATVIINKHKTIKTSGVLKATISLEVSKLIRKYAVANKINYGDKLFGDLKPVLLEITNDRDDKQDGGTRLIRRSVASSLYNDWVNGKSSVEEIYKQMKVMAHSSPTHFKDYIHGVKE